MDFVYHYTDEQARFRQEVSSWLDTNLPQNFQPSADTNCSNSSAWQAWKAFRRKLGTKGWLAPSSPADQGGAGISRSHEVVLLEEMDRRGLRWLVNETANLLSAVSQWGALDQKRNLQHAIASGQVICWRPDFQPDEPLDPRNLGVDAQRDGDDYILNGRGQYVGLGPIPDYVWTLALHHRDDAPPDDEIITFLIPWDLQGMSFHTPRRLVPGEVHQTDFQEVRVPPPCLLGGEVDGWLLEHSAMMAQPDPVLPPSQDQEVADLLEYAHNTSVQGKPISQGPTRQQLLMEAYINSRLYRLFRIRDAWMHATGQRITYHTAQTNLWGQRTTLRLSEIARQVMGPYALLDQQDVRAPKPGNYELQQRKSLALYGGAGEVEGTRGVIAHALGLAERQEGTPTENSANVIANGKIA